jgi:hypothetical protein
MQHRLAILKKYYKRFLLHIHPDYFAFDHAKKQQNEKSLQIVHEIMDNLARESRILQTNHELKFFLKNGTDIVHKITCGGQNTMAEIIEMIKKAGIQLDTKDNNLFQSKDVPRNFNRKEVFGTLFKNHLRNNQDFYRNRDSQ